MHEFALLREGPTVCVTVACTYMTKNSPFSSFLNKERSIFRIKKKYLVEQGASKELYAVPNFHMKSRKAYAWFYTNTVLFCIVLYLMLNGVIIHFYERCCKWAVHMCTWSLITYIYVSHLNVYKSEIVILVTGMHKITSACTPESQLARPDAQPAGQASGFR